MHPCRRSTYFGYDRNGSLVSRQEPAGTTYFAYADHGLVESIAPPTGDPVYFHYDGRLTRTAMTQGAETTYFTWDEDRLRMLELRTDGETRRLTHGHSPIDGIGTVIEEEVVDGERYYHHLDHRGTTYKITRGSDGSVVWSGQVNAWGEELAESGASPSIFWYQGEAWYRLATGDYVSSSRLYEPVRGSFAQKDWLPVLARAALYRAFRSQALLVVDPLGLQGRVTATLYKRSLGIAAAIRAKRMVVAGNAHGKAFKLDTRGCKGGCKVEFKVEEAYKGVRPRRRDGDRRVAGMYIHISVATDLEECGCKEVKLLQAVAHVAGLRHRASRTIKETLLQDPEPDSAQIRVLSGAAKFKGKRVKPEDFKGLHVDVVKEQASPYADDAGLDSRVGANTGIAGFPAEVFDAPGYILPGLGTSYAQVTMKFWTCAVCRGPRGCYQVLACLKWGLTLTPDFWKQLRDVEVKLPKYGGIKVNKKDIAEPEQVPGSISVLAPEARAKNVPPAFGAAVKRWDNTYGTEWGKSGLKF